MTVEYKDFAEKLVATGQEKYLCLIRNTQNPDLVYSADFRSLSGMEITLSNLIHYEQIATFLAGPRFLIEIPYYSVEATFSKVENDNMVFTISTFHKNQYEVLAKNHAIGYFEFINPHDHVSKIDKKVVAKKHHQIVIQNELSSKLFSKGVTIQEGYYVAKDKPPVQFNAVVSKNFHYYNKEHKRLDCFVLNLFS